MTEQEWLACGDPEPMWEFVCGTKGDRKLRLLIVGLYREIWDFLSHPLSRQAIEVAEQYGDGQASEDERVEACISANRQEVLDAASGEQRSSPTSVNLYLLAAQGATDAAGMTHYLVHSFDVAYCCLRTVDECEALRPMVALLRDIFGNPFRSVVFDPAWRTDTAVSLARQMYESREFSAMPILADALQDAGCDNEEVLHHCRDEGTHVRGCWVVDLVLGKE
jgi:hypothetical protein